MLTIKHVYEISQDFVASHQIMAKELDSQSAKRDWAVRDFSIKDPFVSETIFCFDFCQLSY